MKTSTRDPKNPGNAGDKPPAVLPKRERVTLDILNVSAATLTLLLTLVFTWLSWLETHSFANITGVLFLCAGGTAAGAWAGFLYATFGEEADRFKGPFGLVNAFLGGAAVTDIVKPEDSSILGFLRATSESCGFVASTAPIVWALVVFAFCGFMLMYYNKQLLLNLATQRQSNALKELQKQSQAVNTLNKESPLTHAEPGAMPTLTDEAEQAVDVLLESEPEGSVATVEILRARGEAYYVRGNFAEAKLWLQRALTKNPNDQKTLISFAQVHLGEGHAREAIPLLERAAALPDAPASIWKLLGYAYLYDESLLDKAETASKRYLQNYPEDNGAKLNLACVYGQRGPQDAGNRKRCLDLLAEVFKEDPEERNTVRSLTVPGEDFEDWTEDPDFQMLVNPSTTANRK